jgi:hypothetical protein
MTRLERIAIRNLIDARVRELTADSRGPRPPGETSDVNTGEWLPFCRVPQIVTGGQSMHALGKRFL